MAEPLLSVTDLTVHFHGQEGIVKAVDGISFDVDRSETVCLVGESGSGKTVAAEAVTRLHPSPPAEISGEVRFDGTDVLTMDAADLQALRGGGIGHVFQNPKGALNPVYSVGWQLVEAVRLHRDVSKRAARKRAIVLLDKVGIPEATGRFDDYPHEFSGGMRQRVVLAMALAAEPALLIADEPTTALDVTVQAGILSLLADLQEEFEMSVLLITHDFGVVAQVADRVTVLYGGKVMEQGDVYDVFERPAHPYTRALLACLPGRGREMQPIPGRPPDPKQPPRGCRFHPRCSHAIDECESGTQPDLYGVVSGQRASCVFYGPNHDPRELREEGVADEQ